VALNISFLAVARVTQTIDQTGVAAAAHALAIQVFQVGGIVLLALSTVAQIVVPNDMVDRYDAKLARRVGGKNYAKATVNRLLAWGGLLGIGLGSLQLLLLPLIQQTTPLKAVSDAALIPAIFACGLQLLNSLVFIGEGVMVRMFSPLGVISGSNVQTRIDVSMQATILTHYLLNAVRAVYRLGRETSFSSR
jgi:hypothetical protein